MRKQLLLFCLTVFVFKLNVYAQPGTNCGGYPFVLNISGFYAPCDDGYGQVCFEYSTIGWNEDCADLIVEISYPTSGFDFKFSDDFIYSENTSTGISTLALVPPYESEGIISKCFQGQLLIANTVFTRRIYYGSNPSVSIFPATTFTLDNVIEVGTAGQTTSLYSISQPGVGPLLPAGSSNGHSQRIAVEGILEVYQDYFFTSSNNNSNAFSSELIMMPGSKITVLKGNTLHTSYANIHGCDNIWSGIELYPDGNGIPNGGTLDMGERTILKDARVGVQMNKKSTFNFIDSEISDCEIGLASYGPTFKQINFNVMNSFTSISYFRSCNEGIHFENTSLLDLSAGVIGLQFWDMEDYAIYLEGTDLVATSLSMDNCKNGVWVAKPNQKLVINDPQFYGRGARGRGIHTEGTNNLQVNGGFMINWGTGISRKTNIANQSTTITGVYMSRCIDNVWGSVLPSIANIKDNNLNAVGHNLSLSGIGAGSHQWTVEHNAALRSGETPPDNMPNISFVNRNIYFSGINHGSILDNNQLDPFTGSKTFSSPLKNIEIHDSQYLTVGENNPSTTFSQNYNMEIWGSQYGNIYCNNMTGAKTALRVMNNCDFTTIRANDFSGAWGTYNLEYGSSGNLNSSTGPQDKMGNIFDPSSLSSPKAKYFGTSTFAEQSQYIVGRYRVGPSGLLENFQGQSHYPFYIPQTSLWFTKSPNGTDNDNCVPGLIETEVLEKSARTDIGLLDAGIEATYGEEVGFDTKLKLYRSLNRLQAIATLEEDLETWYDALSATDFAKFIQFEDTYRSAIEYPTTEAAQVDQLNLDIDDLNDAMAAIEWWVLDSVAGTATIDTPKLISYEAKKAELLQKMDSLSVHVQSRQTVLDAALSTLTSINNSIGTQSTTSGQNLKTVNGLLLQRYSSSFTGFSEANITILTQIASQCVGEGGEGVYIARALLAEHTLETVEYNDECIVELGERERSVETAPLPTKLQLRPNPADDTAEVTLPAGEQSSSLSLLDAQGHVLQVFEIAPLQASLQLNTSELRPGLYFLVPSGHEGKALRFSVVH